MQKNPYPAQSLIGQIFGHLALKGCPLTVTDVAHALGESYNSVYRAIYRDTIKAVNFEYINGVQHIALNPENKPNKEPKLSINETIQDVMTGDSSEYGFHVHQIVQKAHATPTEVKAFIKEQVRLGNIEVNPTQGKYGNRYRWAGLVKTGIREEMLELDKEMEAESVTEAQLEPTADPKLPDIVTAQPENATIEPNQATNAPKTFSKESKEIANPENNASTLEPQAITVATATPPLNMKISYMITAARGKVERRKKLEAAQSLAKRWANEGYKDVTIHLASEYEHARVTSEVQFKRAL